MITIDDINTAVYLGYEEIARLQLSIAKKSRVSGDVTIHNKGHMMSVKLYAFIDAIVSIPFNHTAEQNKIVSRLYNNIKTLTKDIRQWN